MAEIPCVASGKETACPCRRCDVRDVGWTPGRGNPLEKGKATYSSVLSWRIPWAEEPGRGTVRGVAKGQTRLKQLNTHSRNSKYASGGSDPGVSRAVLPEAPGRRCFCASSTS